MHTYTHKYMIISVTFATWILRKRSGSQARARRGRVYVFKPDGSKKKKNKSEKEERSSRGTKSGENLERYQKVKLNYCIVSIDANVVRIIMIIVIILTIGNSPILSIRLIRLGQFAKRSLYLILSICFVRLSICLPNPVDLYYRSVC